MEVNKVKRRDDLLIGPKEKAIDAVRAGKKDEAIKYIEELSQSFRPLHDRYGSWIEFLLDLIAERLGEETVQEALRGIGIEVYGPWLSMFTTMSSEEIARLFAQAHRVHNSDFYVEEDDEKFTLVIPYCGSGGRIQKEGKTRTTTKPFPWSFNQEGVNYYCCHCPVHVNLYKEYGCNRIEVKGSKQVDEKGKPIGITCKYIIRKGEPEKRK